MIVRIALIDETSRGLTQQEIDLGFAGWTAPNRSLPLEPPPDPNERLEDFEAWSRSLWPIEPDR